METEIKNLLPFLTIAQNFKPNSVRLVIGRLNIFKAWLQNNNTPLSNDAISQFLSLKLAETKNNNTVNSYITSINQLLYFYKDRNEHPELKIIKSLRKTRPPIDILSPAEVKKLWEANAPIKLRKQRQTERNNRLHEVAIMFLGLTGCRYSEMADLKRKDLDLENGYVTFRDTKNSTWRRVGVQEPLLTTLSDWCADSTDECVFTTSRGKPLHSTDFGKELRRRALATGIKKRVYPHIFRHSFISELIKNKVGIEKIAVIVGHKDIKSTQYYQHLSDETLKTCLYSHPLIRSSAPPREIVRNLLEMVKSFNLEADERFNCLMKETNHGLTVKLDWS